MPFAPGGIWNKRIDLIITDAFDVPFTFTSPTLIVIASILGSPNTWIKAGYLTQFFQNPDFGKVESSDRTLVRLNQPTYYSFPLLILDAESSTLGYQLHFEPMEWIQQLTLKIFESSMPLNFEPVISIPSMIASSAASVTVPLSTTSVSLLSANANRKKLVIANNTNQDLYIDLDATASVADHAIKIPKITASGFIANYELENYTGVVSGIWAATGTGAALVRELV